MKNLIIVYDDWCPYCIRFSKLIKKFDILRKISFFKLRKDSIDIENFDNNLALKKMASYKNGIWMYGFESIYRILKEIPLFWFFIPLFYFLKTAGIIYKFPVYGGAVSLNKQLLYLSSLPNNNFAIRCTFVLTRLLRALVCRPPPIL
jgi:predicted DCC family thiol-disulfide oxidoreductase YuxK